MIRQLITNWNPIRAIWLILGGLIVIEGIRNQMPPLTIMGAAFSVLALSNIGYCGVDGCTVAPRNSKRSEKKEIEYKEV